MESNRKRKGFTKGKLMLFYYRSPPKPSSNVKYGSKVKPSQARHLRQQLQGGYVNQDYMIAPQKQVVSFMVPAADYHREKLSQFDKFFGVVGDVSVDTKSTRYISSVQERFKLERIISERKQQLEDELYGFIFMDAKFCRPVS